MSTALNAPAANAGRYLSRGAYRAAAPTGAVTVLAAATASAGQLLNFRNPSATLSCFIKRIGARFTLTTAYTTAQETGCDLILAHAFTVNGTGGTAVDVGSTVAHTGKLASTQPTSVITAGCVRVATASTITAGTHTLDANPFAVMSAWSAGIGDQVPLVTAGGAGGYGHLFNVDTAPGHEPLVIGPGQGFVIRNLILMGAVGVGRWDFLVEWDEGALLDA